MSTPSTAAGKPEIFFVVGEASGDAHTAMMAAELLRLADLRLSGFGGRRMEAAGVQTLADSSSWSGVGVVDSLRRAGRVYRQAHWAVREVLKRRPALVVLVDCGTVNTHIARVIKAANPQQKILYYFPPRSWERKPRDWSPLARVVDGVATPFPWSAEILAKYMRNVRWVGHPATDRFQPPDDRAALRDRLGLGPGTPVIGLLAGSRSFERGSLGPRFLEAAALVRQRLPEAQVLWSAFDRGGRMERRLSTQVEALEYVTPVAEAHDLLAACDMALICFGTATLEAMAAGCPMVTAYSGTCLMELEYLVRGAQAKFYAMPNLILQRHAVPELIHREATGERLADELVDLWANEERRAAMLRDLAEARAALGEPGAATRAAQMALDML